MVRLVSSFIHDDITVHLTKNDNDENISDFFLLYRKLYKMHATLANKKISEDALMLLENCLTSIVRKLNELGYEVRMKDIRKTR